MNFNDQLSQHYSEMLDGTNECVDQIVLNEYYKQCHHPGGFRICWGRLKGSDDDLDKNNLRRMAGRFNRRVYAFADHANIPIIRCNPKDKKHEIAAEYIPDDKNFKGELSRNFLFKRGSYLDDVYQNIIDLSRRRLDIKSLKTIFGWKSRPHNKKHKKSSFQVHIERPPYNLTVLKISDGIMIVKMCDKGERILRIEVTCNNAREIKF